MAQPARDTEALSAWLDGELTDAEAAELEAELERDPELRAELEQLEGVVRLLREEGPVSAPEGFHAKVMERVEEEHPAEVLPFSRLRRSVRWEPFAIALAAAAALLLVIPSGPWLSKAPSEPEGTAPALAVPPRAAPVSPVSPTSSASLEAQGEGSKVAAEQTRAIEPAPQVLGKATTGAPKAGLGAVGAAPEGTPDAAPAAAAPMEPPTPAVQVSAGIAGEETSWRTTVRSEDPSLKRKVLAVAARYGQVRTSTGEAVASSAMASSREQLVVTIDPSRLAAFQQELVGLGLEVDSRPPSDLLAAGPVDVKLTLQLLGGGAASPPEAAPPAADRAMESDVDR